MQQLRGYFFWMKIKGKLKNIPVFYPLTRYIKWRLIRPLHSFFWMKRKDLEYFLKKKGVLTWSQNDSKINLLKDVKKGAVAFVIGNGPSLKACDLDAIADLGVYCFAANRINLIFDQTKWRPNCYLALDRQIYRNGDLTISNMMKENLEQYVFGKEVFDGLSLEYKEKNNVAFTSLKPNSYYQKIDEFSTCPQKYSINGFTVTYIAMQLAYYMGFKNIYLLGVDCNYSRQIKSNGMIVEKSSSPTYFSSKYDSQNANLGYMDGMLQSYETAQLFSKKTNGEFNIYNATRGGNLEIFERINLDELIQSMKNGNQLCK